MPNNPARSLQDGDVSGETQTDVVMGTPVTVAKASYDPGYDLDGSRDKLTNTLEAGYVSEADLKQGYCSYGSSIGEK